MSEYSANHYYGCFDLFYQKIVTWGDQRGLTGTISFKGTSPDRFVSSPMYVTISQTLLEDDSLRCVNGPSTPSMDWESTGKS